MQHKEVGRRIAVAAELQHGVVTRAHLRRLNLTDGQITSLLADGRLVQEHQGVYRVAGTPTTWLTSVALAVAAAGGVASHRTAARLHGLGHFDEVDVAVPVERRPRLVADGIEVHRTVDLPFRHVVRVEGIPTTVAVRTLLDAGKVLSEARVEQLLERALRLRRVTMPEVLGEFVAHARRGRNGTAAIRAVLETRNPADPPTQSELETTAARVIREGGLPRPERQHTIATRRRVYHVDFAWPDRRLVFEVDGRDGHEGWVAQEFDRERDADLAAHGWLVVRVSWRQLMGTPERVVVDLRRTLEARPAA